MYSIEWKTALVIQVMLCVTAVVCSVSLLRNQVAGSWIGALAVATVPLFTPPGFKTYVFASDVLIVVLAFLIATKSHLVPGTSRILLIAACALVVSPVVSTVVGLWIEPSGQYVWITTTYRRLGFLLFFSAGLSGAVGRFRLQDVGDSALFVWTGTAMVGMAQLAGLINVNFGDTEVEAVTHVGAGQGMFMGVNRGAAGLWGASFLVYSLAMILAEVRLSWAKYSLYVVGAVTSFGIVVWMGSRTGMLAGCAGVSYLIATILRRIPRLIWSRVVVFMFLGGVAGVCILLPALEGMGSRIDDVVGMDSDSLSARVQAQLRTVDFVVKDPRALVLGMGDDSNVAFGAHIGGLDHPHSEYVETLWKSGSLGLALYVAFVLMLYLDMSPLGGGNALGAINVVGRPILVAALVSGLAVGAFTTTASRLSSYGMFALLVFGVIVRRLAIQQKQKMTVASE